MARYRVTTSEVQWGTRKAAYMRLDMLRMLAMNGAPNATWEEVGAEQPAEVAKYLHLKCSDCGVSWYGESFVPCLSCGKKATVHKLVFQRVALPEGVALHDPQRAA